MKSVVPVAFAFVGCAYDWDVGPKPASDTSVVVDTAVADTRAETVDCAALLAEVGSARTTAKKCTPSAMVCEQVVTDECGCQSVTAVMGAETNIYANAAQRFRDAGCNSPACGPCRTIKKDFCVIADGGGYACDGP